MRDDQRRRRRDDEAAAGRRRSSRSAAIRSCDLVISACVRVAPPRDAAHVAARDLDAGSRNGTRVRGAALQPNVSDPALGRRGGPDRRGCGAHSQLADLSMIRPIDELPRSHRRVDSRGCSRWSARGRRAAVRRSRSFATRDARRRRERGPRPPARDRCAPPMRSAATVRSAYPAAAARHHRRSSGTRDLADDASCSAQHGITAKVGIARYPLDGVTAAQLARARLGAARARRRTTADRRWIGVRDADRADRRAASSRC